MTFGSTTTSRPSSRVGAEKHGLRRDQGHSRIHRRAPQPTLHQRLGLGEFGAGVDAEQFLRRQLDRSAGEPFSAGDRDDIGQVELALGIVAVERIEEFGEATGLDHHDSAIDETDRPLLRAGVGGLDDTLERAVGRQHEAAVGAGVGGTHARDEDCRGGAAPLRQQPRQCLGGKKRRIAVEHENVLDRAVRRQAAVERPHRRPHRIAGAERRILHDALGRSDGLGDIFHPRPDHDERSRPGTAGATPPTDRRSSAARRSDASPWA